MGILHRRRRRKFTLSSAVVTTVLLLLLTSFPALGFNPSLQFSFGVRKRMEEEAAEQDTPTRRRLGGLGSSPPTCRSKCGRCGPCKPVHVPVQPERSMALEYYPEAWRCKCGNKLFMP